MTDLEKETAFVETISAACPELEIRSACLREHDGEFNDILLVNEDLIFRFPRRAENLPAFLRESKLLTRLQGHLPIPVPQPVFDSGTAAEFGKVFMGYRLIPGQPFSRDALETIKDETLLQSLAGQLADFLKALHRLTTSALDMDLPEMNMPVWAHSFFAEVQKNLFVYMRDDACKTVTVTFEEYFAQGNLHIYPPCLVHGDFGGSNILLEGERISGILDFSGACLSDPALDMASVSIYGEAFFERICQFYSVDELTCRRAAFYRSLFALEEALYGWKSGDEEAFSRGMEQYV